MDNEAALGWLMALGVFCLLAFLGFQIARELLTGKGTARLDISAEFKKDWFGTLLDILFSLSVLAFFGMLALSPFGLAPARSQLYLYIPGFWVAVLVLQALRRK